LDGCDVRVEKLRDWCAAFHARKVDEDFKHHSLAHGDVIPLRFLSEDENKQEIGHGASSNVFGVYADPAHHHLSGVSFV
jgi:hypothetical protein